MTKDEVIVRISTELYYLKHKIEGIRCALDGIEYRQLSVRDRGRVIDAMNLIDESPIFDQGE